MRLTKKQLKVVDVLQNGGYIWLAASRPYLAELDGENRIRSAPLNNLTFECLAAEKVIKKDGYNRWTLA